jgi:hypothetical protein
MLPDRRRGGSRGEGRFLFPVVGAVTGLLIFLAFSFILPSGAGDANGAEAGMVKVPAPGLSVVAGDGSGRVSWTALAGVRGPRYVVAAVPDNTALPQPGCVTTALSCVIGGLADGVTYTVRLDAADAAGAVIPPAWAEVTPYPAVLTSRASALWLNADGIPAAAGTPVSFWPDGSGQDNNARQAQAGNQPVLSTLGSHKAVQFSGSQNLLLDGGRLPSGTTPSVIFAVARLDDPRAATDCFDHILAWGANTTGEGRMIYKGCRTTLAYAETFNTNPLMHPRYAWPREQPVLVTAEITGSGVSVQMDGSPDYSWRNPPGVVTDTVPQETAMVGGAPWWGDSYGWVGLIGEIVVLSGNVSAGSVRAVDGYLLRKWGIGA